MLPTTRFLEDYYANFYHHAGTKVTFRSPRKLAAHIANSIPRLREGLIDILDFGGGDGTIARMVIGELAKINPQCSYRATVVDLYDQLGAQSAETDIRCASDLNAVKGKTFDIVIASAILEHVPDVLSTLHGLFGLMAPLGLFYARTPWATPLKKVFPWYGLRYPMHLHDLGPSYWNRVGARRSVPITILASRPSIVASGFSAKEIARTLLAHLLKFPARVEARIRKEPKDYVWELVGGWEVMLQRDA